MVMVSTLDVMRWGWPLTFPKPLVWFYREKSSGHFPEAGGSEKCLTSPPPADVKNEESLRDRSTRELRGHDGDVPGGGPAQKKDVREALRKSE